MLAVMIAIAGGTLRSKARSERTVVIETADKLTDPQIVAKVKDHSGIDNAGPPQVRGGPGP